MTKAVASGIRLPSAIILMAGLALAGCSPLGLNLGNGSASGAIGRQLGGPERTAATAGGLVAEGLVGNQVGLSLDAADRRLAAEAELRALQAGRAGTPVTWRSAGSGRYGEVVPGASYRVNAYSCRDYTHTVYADGRPDAARGTACRGADGAWRVVS